jgi:hypothetical protein
MQNWDDELRNIMERKMNDLVKRNVMNNSSGCSKVERCSLLRLG